MNKTTESLSSWIGRQAHGVGLPAEEVLYSMIPLMRQVLDIHQQGKVAPLNGIETLKVNEGVIWFENAMAFKVQSNLFAVNRCQRALSKAFEITGEVKRDIDVDLGVIEEESVHADSDDATLEVPHFLAGYKSWEHTLTHHDALTDIYSLGMLLASLACGLNFNNKDDVERFVSHRNNLFSINPDLHPVIASLIVKTTTLNRHERVQDLNAFIDALENYRYQQMDATFAVDEEKLSHAGNVDQMQKVICQRLRNRLFEVTRRNRLLYFRPTANTLNLTEGSVPLLLDYTHIRPQQLFYWHDDVSQKVLSGNKLALRSYLRFEDAPYLVQSLNTIRKDSAKDKREYGFSQLRLVIAFLHWNNLKEAPNERIHSPLLLLPVELTKKKGVKDEFILQSKSSEAEINPTLSHHLNQLYGFKLPAKIDLEKKSIQDFYESLKAMIAESSAKSVELNLVDKPRIQLIQEVARRRLDNYRRRRRLSGKGVKHFENLDYSYDSYQYNPLGLQLFLRKIKPAAAPLQNLLSQKPRPRHAHIKPDSAAQNSVKKQRAYALDTQGEGNPYAWEFDLCSVTLGNFNYRKMTLVNDYNELTERSAPNASFEQLFLSETKAIVENIKPLSLESQHLIVPADPTQVQAIAHARSGKNLIIQGPPGTGKSQTITNLIADYAMRGKRVLFVCEKRAAIDVVFNRLKQSGLEPLVTLIHDSQSDKKAFVHNLRDTFERYQKPLKYDSIQQSYQRVLDQQSGVYQKLESFTSKTHALRPEHGCSLNALLERIIALDVDLPSLETEHKRALPSILLWDKHKEAVVELCGQLESLGLGAIAGNTPVRFLAYAWLDADSPVEHFSTLLENAIESLDSLEGLLDDLGIEQNIELTALSNLIDHTQALAEWHKRGYLNIAQSQSATTEAYHSEIKVLRNSEKRLEETREKTTHWLEKLNAQDTEAALEQATHFKGLPIICFLMPSYWRLKKTLETHYDFSAHKVRPKWEQILSNLKDEHDALESISQQQSALIEKYSEADIVTLEDNVAELQAATEHCKSLYPELFERLFSGRENRDVFNTLEALKEGAGALAKEIEPFYESGPKATLEQLSEALARLEPFTEHLPVLLSGLRSFSSVSSSLRRVFLETALTIESFEAAVCEQAIQAIYQSSPELIKTEGGSIQSWIGKAQALSGERRKLCAQVIVSAVQQQFLENINKASLPAAQLDDAGKAFKKAYNAGRREVEHEFGKSMRYKSIRDLVDGESGIVVRDLKPIWLMSPLSVSDTLPLNDTFFDVVVFDEASQIRVEEAVPTLYRSQQTIIVGDEMQLPPTTFFASGQTNDEDELAFEDEDRTVELDLNAPSLLNQASRQLPSTLLGWHYRSRYESLIAFSNAAFYKGELLTIPENRVDAVTREPIVVQEVSEGEANATLLLERSISYHRLENGVYEKRHNKKEAYYIAHLVKSLLAKETQLTIGIVAFSEAQQTEIENALSALAEDDAAFRKALEAEYEREEEEQFVGLFVKNLENVQGDERDIIIISVCYGYDAKGKMLMNFGPINKGGGEKRLNVIFSRARLNMAIVSSISSSAITNDYNDGAHCLKSFLHYAEYVSAGDMDTARRVLHRFQSGFQLEADAELERGSPVTRAIKALVEKDGYSVDLDVGQSQLQCHLAIRKPDEREYRLGILVDGEGDRTNKLLHEHMIMQSTILNVFGWRVLVVLTQDWYQNQDAVLKSIHDALLAEPIAAIPVEAEEENETQSQHEESDAETEEREAEDLPVESDQKEEAIKSPSQNSSATPSVEEVAFKCDLEFKDEKSSKFWSIKVVENEITTHFGRIGTKGQKRTKTTDSADAAVKEAKRLMNAKLKKGYCEVEGESQGVVD